MPPNPLCQKSSNIGAHVHSTVLTFLLRAVCVVCVSDALGPPGWGTGCLGSLCEDPSGMAEGLPWGAKLCHGHCHGQGKSKGLNAGLWESTCSPTAEKLSCGLSGKIHACPDLTMTAGLIWPRSLTMRMAVACLASLVLSLTWRDCWTATSI